MNILSLWFFDFVILFRDFVCVFDMGFSICIFFILCFSVLYWSFCFLFCLSRVWCFDFCLVSIARCEIYLKWAAGINNFFR